MKTSRQTTGAGRKSGVLTTALRGALATGVAALATGVSTTVVQACEGCRSSMESNTEAAAAGVGFSASIFFMLGVPLISLGFIVWQAVKNCRAIEAAREAQAASAGA